MHGKKFLYGAKVVIRAEDHFFAFVDGWQGTCVGYTKEGYCIVRCQHSEGPKTFFVPDAQLEAQAA